PSPPLVRPRQRAVRLVIPAPADCLAFSSSVARSLVIRELRIPGNDRDLRQGRGGHGRVRYPWAVVQAHVHPEPVPAGRNDVTEILAGARGSEEDWDAD